MIRISANRRNSAVAAIALGALLTGCFLTAGNYLMIDGKGDIALVSFSIDRRILHEHDSSATAGPALLTSKETKERFWDNHQRAVDQMYEQFRAEAPAALFDVTLIDHQTIAENDVYRELTKHEPRIIMGQDVSPGWSQISAAGLRHVSPHDDETLDSLCTLFGVTLAMTVDCEAKWHVIDSVAIEGTPPLMKRIPLGYMMLDASVYLHEKGKGLVWSRTYRRMNAGRLARLQWSSGEAPLMKPEDFGPQLTSALKHVYTQIAADAQRGREAALEQAAAEGQ
jgi:hypothetical protein